MATTSWPICSAKLEFNARYKLPVQFDTAIEINLTNETHRDEDDAFAKVSTLPSGILAVRVFGCVGLSSSDFKIDDDIVVYARVIAGALGKSTHHSSFAKGKPIWNECLFFPVQLTGNPKSTSNRLVILIIWRDEAQDKKNGISSHKLLGRAEFTLYKVIKHFKAFETVDIMNRRQQVVGQLQIEMAVLYGPFGFGLSPQLENNLFRPEEMVKISFYPKVAPSAKGPQFRGVAVIPKKVPHPSFIPFNGKVKSLEPSISGTYGKPLMFSGSLKFPALAASMKRLPGLQLGLQQQKSRTKRIAYLRSVLRDLDKVEIEEERRSSINRRSIDTTSEEPGTSGGGALQTVSEDGEDQSDKFSEVSAPLFVRSLDKLVKSVAGSSEQDSLGSLQLVDAPPQHKRKHHYRRSSVIATLFIPNEEH